MDRHPIPASRVPPWPIRTAFAGMSLLGLLASVPGEAAVRGVGAGCAFATVPDAVAAATSGDIVAVIPGVYGVTGLTVTDDLWFYPADGNCNPSATAGTVTLDGGGAPILTVDGAGASFVGFAFTNGSSADPTTGGLLTLRGGGESYTFVNTSFQGGTAPNGGAIYVEATTDSLVFTGTTEFSGNAAFDGYGGALAVGCGGCTVEVLGDATFEGNSATLGGGAIYGQGTRLVVDADGGSATFGGNDTSLGSGGAIDLFLGPGVADWLSVRGGIGGSVLFSGNTAATHGGAIHAWDFFGAGFDLAFDGTDFLLNASGDSGGAVALDMPAAVTFVDCSFTGNGTDTAGEGHGGGLALLGSGTLVLEDTAFSLNYAEDGGAIRAEDTGIDAEDVTFTYNLARNDGGAVSFEGSAIDLSVDGVSEFRENEAGEQGGVIAAACTDCTLEVLGGATFGQNLAVRGSGGAIHGEGVRLVLDPGDAILSFVGNRSDFTGGAIDLQDTPSQPDWVVFAAGGGGSVEFEDNFAWVGGAVAMDGDSPSATVRVEDTAFRNNSAYYSGAILIFSAGDLDIVDCEFAGNIGEDDGGGVYAVLDGDLAVADSTFQGNASGAIDAWAASLSIDTVQFSANYGWGYEVGAVTYNGFNGTLQAAYRLSIVSSTFEDNHGLAGGAVWADGAGIAGATVDIRDSMFTGNVSDSIGGGVASVDAGAVSFVNVRFVGNEALDTAGSGAFVEGNESFLYTLDPTTCDPTVGGPDFYCSEMRDNVGSALVLRDQASAEVRQVAFVGNVAQPEAVGLFGGETIAGTAIDVEESSDLVVSNSLFYRNGVLPASVAVRAKGYAGVGGHLEILASTFANNAGRAARWGQSATGRFEQSIDQRNGRPLRLHSTSSVDVLCSNLPVPDGPTASYVDNQDVARRLFIDQAADDYRLRAGSPSRDACDPAVYTDHRPDLLDHPAVGVLDQGAYERQ